MLLPVEPAGEEAAGADAATGVGVGGAGAAAGAAAAAAEGDAAEPLTRVPQSEQNCAPGESGTPQLVQNAAMALLLGNPAQTSQDLVGGTTIFFSWRNTSFDTLPLSLPSRVALAPTEMVLMSMAF